MNRYVSTLLAVVCLPWLVACSPAIAAEVDSGTDAATRADAVADRDAPASPDTGAPDSGAPDGDGDGTPDATDCDPADPLIGDTSERPCSSECEAGVETCTGGVWAACDATADCVCTVMGMTRGTACSDRCGRQLERCVSGRWTVAGPCSGEGECAADTTETRTTIFCGETLYTCGRDCHWDDGMVTREDGECPAGATTCLPGIQQVCTDDCHWVDNPGCV